jgi:RHS repeat-associated protein
VNGTLVQGLLYKDRLRPAAELDGAGNVVSLFVYGEHPNVPSYMIRGGTEYRIVTDHAGSPRLVIEVGGGAIAQRMDYDAFGRVLVDTQPGFQPFGFAGGLYDPDTGLVRFGERDYDAETGRWTTKDRSLFTGRTENLYAYVSNDPLNRVDRWGRALCYLGPTAGLAPDEYCEEVPPGTFEEDCDDPEDHCQQVGRNYDGSYSDDWSIDGGTAGGSTKTACDEEMVTCDIESITTDEQRSGEGPSPDGRDIGEDLDKEMKDDMDRKDLEEKEGDAAGPKPCP